MPQTLVTIDIPADEVDAIAQSFKSMDAKTIEMIKQPDGRFTLKVTVASDDDELTQAPSFSR